MFELRATFESFDELQKFLNRGIAIDREEKIPLKYEEQLIENKEPSSEISSQTMDFSTIKTVVLELGKIDREEAIIVLKQFNDKNGKPCERVTAVLEADYAALYGVSKRRLSELAAK